jgi:MarR-like DNA-binding transcriptional regulator SgrR of sgrS sRNA
LATLIILTALGLFVASRKQHVTALKVVFPIRLLQRNQSLLDPYNTETVWEYYLLENLACGLVRDSVASSTGYDGCLAENFYQPDPKTWVFKVKDIRWSSGEPISVDEIDSWIHNLSTGNHRHIRYLKKARSIEFDPHSRLLTFKFDDPIGNVLLHELSLADATFIPTDFKKNGWHKTAGPYFVKLWKPDENRLVLEANIYSPIFSERMPREIELFACDDPEQRNAAFTSFEVDILPVSAHARPSLFLKPIANAPQTFWAYPTTIYFFNFNSRNALAKIAKIRHAFAGVVREIRSEIDNLTLNGGALKMESQMIPLGFQGRLTSVIDPSWQPAALKGQTIRIALYSSFQEQPSLIEALQVGFQKYGVDLQIQYDDASKFKSDDQFVIIYGFVGNQLDASGSWSFLLGPNGPLNSWTDEIADDYSTIFESGKAGQRDAIFKGIHQRVLSESIAVPLLIGQQRYLMSQRINFDRWNKFDARMRFYELRWN